MRQRINTIVVEQRKDAFDNYIDQAVGAAELGVHVKQVIVALGNAHRCAMAKIPELSVEGANMLVKSEFGAKYKGKIQLEFAK